MISFVIRRTGVVLDGTPLVQAIDRIDTLADRVARLGHWSGRRVLGGCCGTDGEHMKTLATKLLRADGPASAKEARS